MFCEIEYLGTSIANAFCQALGGFGVIYVLAFRTVVRNGYVAGVIGANGFFRIRGMTNVDVTL